MEIDWQGFRQWLEAKHPHSNANTIFNVARRYQDSLLDASKASLIQSLTFDKRRHVMSSLANLAKFAGLYEAWKQTMKQAGLKWEKAPAASIVRSILSQEAD